MVFASTEKLFHDSPYERVSTALLESIEKDDRSHPFAILSRTLFYPQGGGQKGDRGEIALPNGEVVLVTDTRNDGDLVRHYLEEGSEQLQALAAANEVEIRLDWDARYQQMRIHSASHLIHCFLEHVQGRTLPAPKQSPLGPEAGENQYDYADLFDEAALLDATQEMNAFINEGAHPILTVSDEQRGHDFRWWKCEDWSIPCGGVHPRDAAEVGAVTTSMRIKKGKARVEIRLEP